MVSESAATPAVAVVKKPPVSVDQVVEVSTDFHGFPGTAGFPVKPQSFNPF